ncbi:hypothetical protein V8E53_009334 [Lactarius tabidus]
MSIYRIPLSSPAAMAKKIKTRARSLASIPEGVEIKHLLALLPVIASVREEPTSKEKTGSENPAEEGPPTQ